MKSSVAMKQSHYQWRGISTSGKKISGEMTAKNIFYVKVYLQKQGITPLKIHKKNILFQDKINETQIAHFLRQLGTLINAGIPLVQACHTLELSQHHTFFKKIIISIKSDLESGKELTHCFTKYPRYFDTFVCHLTQLGEQTGTLDHALSHAATYKEKQISLNKHIKQALFYPAMISCVAVIITLIMLLFIVPRFAELFQNMHHQLPALTRAVLFFSNLLRDYYWMTSLPILLIAVTRHYWHRSKTIRYKIDYVLLSIPLFGHILQKIILSRLTRTLATSLSAGLTVLSAVKLLTTCTKSHPYLHAIEHLQQDITKGLQLNAAMQTSPLFPPLMLQMIKVGEESGMLSKMLEKIAILYEDDVDHFIAQLKQLLEPLIMIILGVLIGGLVVAMYLPIFKLGTVI